MKIALNIEPDPTIDDPDNRYRVVTAGVDLGLPDEESVIQVQAHGFDPSDTGAVALAAFLRDVADGIESELAARGVVSDASFPAHTFNPVPVQAGPTDGAGPVVQHAHRGYGQDVLREMDAGLNAAGGLIRPRFNPQG